MSKDYEKLKVKKPKLRYQIGVLGSSKSICTKKAYELAFKVGQEIAKRGHVTLTGGGHGVMEAAMKGAKKEGGQTIAVLPWETMDRVNDYADIKIATGIGWSRDSINVTSSHGAILVHGGAGTLNEATFCYMMRKPTVALIPSGGVAAQVADRFFDERHTTAILGVNTPKEAVEKLLDLISKDTPELTKFDELRIDAEAKQNRKVKIKNAKN